ncbi:MAG: transketolase [Candidatus Woesearchaeota archaeon]
MIQIPKRLKKVDTMNKNITLKNIASILRRDSLNMTTKAGSGHPTTCLSCAEIISTLFFDEMSFDKNNPDNPDNDEFILSKGHAAPILYSALFRSGCIKTDLLSLRNLKSPLEGHPVPRSLKWVKVATGSLGQGLSNGVGMAIAGKKQKKDFRVYVLLGDSECAEGSVYEAVELAVHYKLNNICAIIDINRLGQSGPTMLGHNILSYKKRFESFGCNVIAVNGHNIAQIQKALNKARKAKSKPTVILAKTFKGNGVSFLKNKDGWHGKALNQDELSQALKEIPDPKIPRINIKKPKKKAFKIRIKNKRIKLNYILGDQVATRQAYGYALTKLANNNNTIIALDGETSNSTHSEELRKSDKSRYIECFIAEQNMVGMAAGLSTKGFNPFASTFSAFFSRAHDQIRMNSISTLSITYVGSHAGVSIGEDGGSQMGLEDIAMFRCLPGSIVFYPSDAVSCEKLVELASRLKGTKYIRTSRPKTPIIYKNSENFILGDFKILRKSNKDKAIIIGAGITLHESLKAHDILKDKGISTAVVDCYCIKPFDKDKLIKLSKTSGKKVIVAEDHYHEGGIGEMISQALAGTDIMIKSLAVHKLPHSGKEMELLKFQGIDADSIVKEVIDLVK